jgi:hypothetical protein
MQPLDFSDQTMQGSQQLTGSSVTATTSVRNTAAVSMAMPHTLAAMSRRPRSEPGLHTPIIYEDTEEWYAIYSKRR